jgi:electron transport complex protein RnfG
MSESKPGTGILKLGLTLAAFATAACVVLAFVYAGTAGIIKQRQEEDLKVSLREIFTDMEKFEYISGIQSPDPAVTIEKTGEAGQERDKTYEILKGSERIGLALVVSRGSYGGPIKILVGVGMDGRIAGIKIQEHQDTPGLGANAASPSYFVDRPRGITFMGQFTGKAVSDPFEVRNDIVAITASTITSRAVTDAVKAAGAGAAAYLGGSR